MVPIKLKTNTLVAEPKGSSANTKICHWTQSWYNEDNFNRIYFWLFTRKVWLSYVALL